MSGTSILLSILIGLALYFLPAVVAYRRNHNNMTSIFLFNLFLGWSFFGWVISLVWSFSDNVWEPSEQAPSEPTLVEVSPTEQALLPALKALREAESATNPDLRRLHLVKVENAIATLENKVRNRLFEAVQDIEARAATLKKRAAQEIEAAIFFKKKDELKNELIEYFNSIIWAHRKTLILKLEQTGYIDDYGKPNFEKFRPEREYFINRVLTSSIPKSTLNYLLESTPIEYVFDEILISLVKEETTDPCDINTTTTPTEYEHICCAILRNVGWNARTTQSSGDQGADVLASMEGKSIAIQCKLYSGSVGNSAVQEVIAGQAFYRTDFAAVVSNAGYTEPARQLASASNVLLLHHSDLQRLNEKIGIKGNDQLNVNTNIKTEAKIFSHKPIEEIIQEANQLQQNQHKSVIEEDPLYGEALTYVIKSQNASISAVQRHLRCGYNRVAKMIEHMEQNGIVGPIDENGTRRVKS